MGVEVDSELSTAARRQILANELDVVMAKLDQSITTMIADVEENLFAKAESSSNDRQRHAILDAYNVLRARRKDIEFQFRRSFRDLLDQSIAPPPVAPPSAGEELVWEDLSLVDTDQIEEDVQLKRIVDKIKTSVEWELRDLNARMSYLRGHDGAEESDNPLRPELFCRALGRACAELQIERSLRLEVMGGFEAALSQRIGVVYQELNARLISRRVLPRIRHAAQTMRNNLHRAAGTVDGGVPDGAAALFGPGTTAGRLDDAVENVVERTLSMFEALQQLVGTTPAYRQGTWTGEGSPAALSRRSLINAIVDLREAHALALDLPTLDSPAAPIGAAQPQQPIQNFLRANREHLTAAAGTPLDRMKIDIVTMLFDQIFADDKLPSDFKMLIARLQLPVLRVALADGSFFASRGHPTRRLIDRIATCAVGYDKESEGGRRFFAEIERIALSILRSVIDDSSIYEQLLKEFEQFLDRERAQANDIVGRAADVLERTEVREILGINATIQITQLLYGIVLDASLRDFLLDVWTHVLVEAACRSGGGNADPAVARYKQLCSDLVWSVQPKTHKRERRRLVEILPGMIAGLREGLALISYPKDQEQHFFGELMQMHSRAVRAQGPLAAGGIDIDQFAHRLREMVVEHDIRAVKAVPAKRLSKHAASRVAAESKGEIEVVQCLDSGDSSTADLLSSLPVDTLERGSWFKLMVDKMATSVRLAWISPLKTFYLFIAADGTRAHSLNLEALKRLLGRGELAAVEDAPLVDRAVRSVLHQLEHEQVA